MYLQAHLHVLRPVTLPAHHCSVRFDRGSDYEAGPSGLLPFPMNRLPVSGAAALVVGLVAAALKNPLSCKPALAVPRRCASSRKGPVPPGNGEPPAHRQRRYRGTGRPALPRPVNRASGRMHPRYHRARRRRRHSRPAHRPSRRPTMRCRTVDRRRCRSPPMPAQRTGWRCPGGLRTPRLSPPHCTRPMRRRCRTGR